MFEDLNFTLRRHPVLGGAFIFFAGLGIVAYAINCTFDVLRGLGLVAK